MKLFGHPLHPLFVHFPTALLPMDLVLSLLYYAKNDASFALAGFYCLVGGVVSGFAAVATGLLDLVNIPKANKVALGSGLIHGFVNGFLLLVFGIIGYKEWQQYPQLFVTPTVLMIKSILVLALFVGNYLGGRLIYQHFIGLDIKSTAHGKNTSESRVAER
jgi:uncharacterized membrane protein